MRIKARWWLAAILLLAIGLRFFRLGTIPYPLNGDEKAFGYYGWSIANWGKDEYGNKFPTYFPSIGDYKYPVYAYLTAPVAKILGLSEHEPRVVSAAAGVGMVILVYQFCIMLFKSKTAGLAAALIMAICPWSLTFSRTASESNLMSFLAFWGIFMLSKYFLEKRGRKYLIGGMVFIILSLFTYSAGRIFVPIMLLGTAVFWGLKQNKKLLGVSVLIFLLVTGISVLALRAPESRVRASGISMISNDSERKEWLFDYAMVLGLGEPVNPIITRIFFNKGTALILEYAERYLSHFSPQYLFVSGDIVRLNSIQNLGNFYIFEILFLIAGLGLIIKPALKLRYGEYLILLGILAGPVAAAGSIETPSAVRQLAGLPYLVMAMGMGAVLVVKKIKMLAIPLGMVYVYFLGFLILSMFKVKPYQQPWKSDQGNKEVAEKVWNLKDKYKYVFMADDPYIDFLFYKKIGPDDFLKRAKIEDEVVGKWSRVKNLDNIIFKAPENCPKIGQVGALYVCVGVEVPRAAKLVDVVRFNDGVPKYALVEFEAMKAENQGKIELPTGLKYMVEGDGRHPKGVFEEKNRYYYGLYVD